MTESSTAAFQPEIWTASSNTALKVSLADTEGHGAVTFAPQFTYPIFGDAETVFGYKNLAINLVFDSWTMKPFLNVKYDEKLADHEEKELYDKLLAFLPEEVMLRDEGAWVDACTRERATFEIPGTKIASFTSRDSAFSVYRASFRDLNTLELHRRLQIFVLLFIEAGSYIDETDDLWELFLVYEDCDKPRLAGFATAYSYFKYEGAARHDVRDVAALSVRKKISQFIVLPPYQSRRVGAKLYDTLMERWLADPLVAEVTVEDPSEAFDDLRDRCDLTRLARTLLADVRAADVDADWLRARQRAEKLDARQFHRLTEMALVHQGAAPRATRLLIKRRLYAKNRDALADLEEATRKDKLHTAYERLVEDYQRITEKVSWPAFKRPAEQAEQSKKQKV
ncbi:hypothetical protein BABINDRAFT_162030 [Babjeviella inositovora NRRL Y-12698]|uniref:Histone acetyltransferase type B catalytic subunit n=1 Tax=Babjeviella inositovora NRRL Y-12698 TaxID=984486 RepID=A0A1E3QPM9_9ASCO|nr:uncharacterized protein BABINDRAFT_162030 [Babjeviella inositovora NRRL Y-12698]ODQ79663.1 hypothetical protein BABINDRAFT_162030 [Babjeviella inositovora NRRL Y-12698]